ncbi:aspartyl-phosphate phosphatase Spo0E family protein [Paenibacillus sp. S150]|uniref:aspartyl-phosphate phosphatase Spo0E family protein n=1 Tax=Paenibacillus sp. S150 TaxID=2749826 RepID=UPI001C583C17|nr:aspartyl-phosphate phosphatase Spo0E family protein [Paenibacillus sp. S150]MBW4079918.1 aspartyl-phosphate phosphatase Spo0E family protein [Paenibacillus sp. S150]
MKILRSEIEKKRKEMNQLAKKFGLSDERVLMKSWELDCLLNRYQCENNKQNKNISLLLFPTYEE